MRDTVVDMADTATMEVATEAMTTQDTEAMVDMVVSTLSQMLVVSWGYTCCVCDVGLVLPANCDFTTSFPHTGFCFALKS